MDGLVFSQPAQIQIFRFGQSLPRFVPATQPFAWEVLRNRVCAAQWWGSGPGWNNSDAALHGVVSSTGLRTGKNCRLPKSCNLRLPMNPGIWTLSIHPVRCNGPLRLRPLAAPHHQPHCTGLLLPRSGLPKARAHDTKAGSCNRASLPRVSSAAAP